METKEQRKEFFENLIDAIRDIKRQIQRNKQLKNNIVVFKTYL